MELKPLKAEKAKGERSAFNRTFMELKQSGHHRLAAIHRLLIAPLWN